MLTARFKAPLIGLALLLAGTGTILGWEVSGAPPIDSLASLEPPPQLRFTVAHHIARHLVDHGVDAFGDCRTGRCRAQHVTALARHAALFDRPRFEELDPTAGSPWALRAVLAMGRAGFERVGALEANINALWAPPTPTGAGPESVFGRSGRLPADGNLIDGEPFPDGGGWIVRDRDRTFGTTAAIDGMILAVRTVMAEYPESPPLFIADMSLEDGGPMPPHRSHQSGRDVDVSYYTRDGMAPQVRHVPPELLDEKRTWTFLRTLLTRAKPEMIFMSVDLQVRLYEYAESVGEHPAWLDRIFEFGPRGHSNRRAIVRLAPGHTTHMHIRFACSDIDVRCASD